MVTADSWIKEILSGNIPYHDSPNEPALIKSITDGIVPKQTHTLVGVDFVVRLLTEKMWSRAPEDRPNMKEVNEAMVCSELIYGHCA
jgi:hypothetical protein